MFSISGGIHMILNELLVAVSETLHPSAKVQIAGQAAAKPRLAVRTRKVSWAAGAALALIIPQAALADSASLSVTTDQQLRFGTFVVPSTGSRSVTSTGVVTNNAVLPIGSDPVGPAQFTIIYDRGSNNGKPISVVVQVFLSGGQTVRSGNVSGTLSAFDTDLPGIPNLLPGLPVIITMANCTQRQCTQIFHVGARLDVSRSGEGASLIIPLPVTASLLAVL